MDLLRDDNCAQMIHCFFDNFPIRLNSVILLLFPSSVNGNHFASSTLKHLCKCDCLFARRRNAHFCRYRNVERSHKCFDCLINVIMMPTLKMRKKQRGDGKIRKRPDTDLFHNIRMLCDKRAITSLFRDVLWTAEIHIDRQALVLKHLSRLDHALRVIPGKLFGV